MKKKWIDLAIVAAIVVITFFAWKGILNQTIEGEGFYYFDPPEAQGGLVGFLIRHDNISRAFTFVAGRVFGGNMPGYMTSQLAVILLLAVCEYFIIKAVSKSRLIAFTATLYFALNFSGNYQMYARGHFQWFTQRVVELFPFLFSLFFISKFYDKEKYKYYFLSFIFFFLAILTSHYTTLLLPLYPSFLFVMAITKNVAFKKRVLYFLLSAPFILLNYSIVRQSSLGKGVVNPPDINQPFYKQAESYFLKVSHQLVSVTLPFSTATLFARTFNSSELAIQVNAPFSSLPFYKTSIPIEALKIFIIKISVLVYLSYGGVIWFLYKKRSPHAHIVFALFLALIGDLFFSAYTNRFDVYAAIFESRYFFLPGLYVGIIFACFAYNLLPKRKHIFILFLLLTWALINFKLIDTKMAISQYKYRAQQAMLSHLKNTSKKLPDNSVVFLPSPPMPGAEIFLEKFYNNNSMSIQYYNLDEKWQKKIPNKLDPQLLFVFTYTDEFKHGMKAQLDKIQVVDVSETYRKQL